MMSYLDPNLVDVRFIGADNRDLRFFEVMTDNPNIRKTIPDIINEEQMETQYLQYKFHILWNND